MYLVRPAANNNRIRPCSGKIPGWYTRKPAYMSKEMDNPMEGEAADLSQVVVILPVGKSLRLKAEDGNMVDPELT